MAPAPELEPVAEPAAAPILHGFLVPLALMAVFVVAAGLTWMAAQVVDALFGWFEASISIPLTHIHFKVAPFGKIHQALVSALNDATRWSFGRATGFFHTLANFWLSIGDEILGLAILGGYLAWYVTRKYALPVLEGRGIGTQQQQQHTEVRVKKAAQEAHAAKQTADHPEVGKVRQMINTRIGEARYEWQRLHAQDDERITQLGTRIDQLEVGEITPLQRSVRQTQRQALRTDQHVGRLEKLLEGIGVVALVGTVLARVGAGWLLCRNWKRIGRDVCGLPGNLVSDLLALLTDFFILENICQVIPWIEAAFSEVAGPLIGLLTKVGAGVCDAGYPEPAPLQVPQLYLPQSTSLTLHLP